MIPPRRLSLLAAACWLASCASDVPAPTVSLAHARSGILSLSDAEWSTPVKLGSAINVPSVTDGNATLSPDGLSLYYDSDRDDLPGAQGARDMWVSRRACRDASNPACDWQTPVNLGPNVNTPYVDGSPTLSRDGHLLFFLSHTSRPDCPVEDDERDPTRPCDADVFVSWRANPKDDLGWGPAIALPAPVNTTNEDNVSDFVAGGARGDDEDSDEDSDRDSEEDTDEDSDAGLAVAGTLYFSRAPVGSVQHDIYTARIRVVRRGHSAGPVVTVQGTPAPVAELNHSVALDAVGSVRRDGREIFFASSVQRPGGLGAIDIWTATRRSAADPWGTPTNVAALNTSRLEVTPKLSRDGLTIIFTSNRDMSNAQCIAAGLVPSCGWDIYMATRSRVP